MTAVRVILRSDVDGLGKRGDIVEVTKGYARNFLEPRSLALPATDGAAAQAGAMRRARDIRDANAREAASKIASALVNTPITIEAKAGGGGRLFGSVTTSDVAEAIESQTGFQIDRKDLVMDDHIKQTGTYQVTAHLHSEVQFPITVEVAAV